MGSKCKSRQSLSAIVGSILLATLVACGGGGGSSDTTGGTTGGTGNDSGSTGSTGGDTGELEVITETDITIPRSTQVLIANDPGGSSQADLDAATYQIMLFWSGPNGAQFNEALGTGFAIGGDLIATNAHVTQEVLNRSRLYFQSGFRLTRASAFRAETGDEVPLLEALTHPSYTDPRSPDIGLFVARAGLPVALKIASNSEVAQMRRGDNIVLNGFPGDVYDLIFSRGFQPGLSIPRATLFSGNVQSLQKFDERSVIDPNNPLNIDMIQHSMDTSGGTSGSPILLNGKVVGVHNSGLQFSAVAIAPDGTPTVRPGTTQATASWGVHVKHLKNLIAEYNTGVMEADKRFRIPLDDALLVTGGQSNGSTADTAGSFSASVSNPNNANVAHQIQMTIDASGNVTGTSTWPANVSGGARQFQLSGSVDANGVLEVTDNTPEINPGFRRGLYKGNINPASGVVTGEYYEYDETENQIYYFGDWSAQL